MKFKAGFVSIIGEANAGKSTLFNAIINKKLSVINSKPNLTRDRILGMYNDKKHQIIFSDTPGLLDPKYRLQKKMMDDASSSLIDADLILLMLDYNNKNIYDKIFKKIIENKIKYILLINKIDIENNYLEIVNYWKNKLQNLDHPPIEIMATSAKYKINFSSLIKKIKNHIPIHPPYYDQDMISDRPIKFFVEEIIREKIFSIYHNEIPYSSLVQITQFKEKENFIYILADIYIERESQRQILIGKKGQQIKKLSTKSRVDIQKLLKKKVYLETNIKIKKNWRKNYKF